MKVVVAEWEGKVWQRMLSGRRLDLINPNVRDIEIEDIARGLARISRWNGQTEGDYSYSVAQHCLLTEKLLDLKLPFQEDRRHYLLSCLLHDASEYVTGDLISPFKAFIGKQYKDIEMGILRAVHARYGLPTDLPVEWTKMIKLVDRIAARLEAEFIAGFERPELDAVFSDVGDVGQYIELCRGQLVPASSAVVQERYLQRFYRLKGNNSS